MTPHEKAVNALNRRLERLQADLRDSETESTRRFLFQSIVVTLGLGEALNDYIRMVGDYAKRRHGELKKESETLTAEHDELLRAGKEMLEKFKANPTDRALRKEIEATQRSMEAIQKNVRRSANALQREVAPSIALIDPVCESVRRISEADDSEALKRLIKALLGQVRDLYADHPALPAKDIVEVEAWEKSAAAEIDQAIDRYDAYARAGYQAIVGLDMMTLAVSENPPRTAEDATQRANEVVATRVKAIAARFTAG